MHTSKAGGVFRRMGDDRSLIIRVKKRKEEGLPGSLMVRTPLSASAVGMGFSPLSELRSCMPLQHSFSLKKL